METSLPMTRTRRSNCVREVVSGEIVLHYRTGCIHSFLNWLVVIAGLIATAFLFMMIGSTLYDGLYQGVFKLHGNELIEALFAFAPFFAFAGWCLTRMWPGQGKIVISPEGIKWDQHQVAFKDIMSLDVVVHSTLAASLELSVRPQGGHESHLITRHRLGRWSTPSILTDVKKAIDDRSFK